MECLECARLTALLSEAVVEHATLGPVPPLVKGDTDNNLNRSLETAFAFEAVGQLETQLAEHKATHNGA